MPRTTAALVLQASVHSWSLVLKTGDFGSQIMKKAVYSAGGTHSEHTGTGNNYPCSILQYPLLTKLTAIWGKKVTVIKRFCKSSKNRKTEKMDVKIILQSPFYTKNTFQ